MVDYAPRALPCLIEVGSVAHSVVKDVGKFALNILGKGQRGIAYTFFKTVECDGNSIGGQPFSVGATGVPVLDETTAHVECVLVDTVEKGDHSVFVAEVVEAGVTKPFEGRADEAVLAMADLGEKVFYGG